MSRITASADIDQVKPDEVARFTDLFCQNVVSVLNGGLDFASNFNAQTLTLTFPAANVNTTFNHGLKRIPIGYISTGRTSALIVYDGALAHTASVLNLQASAVGTVRLLVY